jgi:rhamnosyl/mannosyltransferase
VSTAETFGLAQLEAMACGIPIINTALSTAVPQVARNGKESITVPPGDPTALATTLRRVLDTPQLRDDLGRGALERVQDTYSRDLFLARIASVYSHAIAG